MNVPTRPNHALRCLVLWLAVAATGCGASARQKTVAATLSAAQAASVAFVAYDGRHQHEIVTEAHDVASGKAALDAWRVNQLEIEKYLVAAFQAIAAEAVADNDPNFVGMVDAAKLLAQTLHTLGVTP